jgi:hypothetical protein
MLAVGGTNANGYDFYVDGMTGLNGNLYKPASWGIYPRTDATNYVTIHGAAGDNSPGALEIRSAGDGGTSISLVGNQMGGSTSYISSSLGVGGTSTGGYTLKSFGSAGKPGGGSWADSSDVRLKTDVMPITNALNLLTQIQGVHFRWINPQEHENKTGVQGGFIAQDIEKTFPGWVTEIDPSGSDITLLSAGGKIKSLTLPFEFDALVVESIKELKKENDELKKENEEQKKLNEEMKARLDKLEEKLTPAVGR